MGDRNGSGNAGVFGKPSQVAVERGLAEFRSGRPVVLTKAGETFHAALPIDGMGEERFKFKRFLLTCRRARCGLHLVITKQRALARLASMRTARSGWRYENGKTRAAFSRSPPMPMSAAGSRSSQPAPAAPAAIELAEAARTSLPALLVAARPARSTLSLQLIELATDAIARLRQATIDLACDRRRGQRPAPEGGLQARFVVFRDAVTGGSSIADHRRHAFDHVASGSGAWLHSACLTGDVFWIAALRLRSDQLRLALRRLDDEGGGIILYLAQEGRGVGLANKMRTYKLQDAGLDTVDANTALGFDDDERDYGIAVRMLEMLGVPRVAMLTNNPAKLDGLRDAGIEVSGRIPLHGPINADNRRYLTAKATRAGHKLDHLLTALAESEPVGDGTP